MGACCSSALVYVQGGKRSRVVSPEKGDPENSARRANNSAFVLALTPEQKRAMQACWRLDIAAGRRRTIVHKTMLFCIEASPKLNEIIACGRYCYRDLTKWPELNAMCQKKYEFFDRLINEFDLDEAAITKAAWQSGQMHALYSKYGLKPHFLDLYVQQFLGLLARFRVTDSYDHIAAIIGFSALLSHIVEIMNHAYAQATKEHRVAARIREENEDAA